MNEKFSLPEDLWKQIKKVIPQRKTPLGSGRWSEKEFFEAIAAKFATKRDWDDLEAMGYPPGRILFQQFIEWRSQRVFACLSEMKLRSQGQSWKFNIKHLFSDEVPRHIREKAERLRVDPDTLVRPDDSAYPPDTIQAEIDAKFPWFAENRKQVNAMVERHRASMFAAKQRRKIPS